MNFVFQWRNWFNTLSNRRKWLPFLSLMLYWAVLFKLGGLKPDHAFLGGAILFLSYSGRRFSTILKFLLPLFLTAIIYDGQRYIADFIRGPIHVIEPYIFDKNFFGITVGNKILTPNEWFGLHTFKWLDLYTGFLYLTFVPIFVIYCAYLYFWKLRGDVFSDERWKLMWAFFWVNMIGYTTYYWYAAAPPWYVSMYGFGPVRLDTPPNAAGCVRFDDILGTKFFGEWYGRSADVFGAIPSLHVAYPFQAVYYAYKFGTGRVFTLIFYLSMCFSAVYLNHHYILDIIWGTSYALLVCWFLDLYTKRKPRMVTVNPQHQPFYGARA